MCFYLLKIYAKKTEETKEKVSEREIKKRLSLLIIFFNDYLFFYMFTFFIKCLKLNQKKIVSFLFF